jgi:soluble P-type ATPase
LAGLVAITDPVRHNAAETIASFGAAGVDLLLITGDAPGTAQAVANQVGLDSSRVITGTEMDAGLDPAGSAEVRVFARIRPEQKLEIVRALQANGHVVAITGDGVNDAPALRRADVGVAIGKDGAEVARQTADLILTDDDLATVVAAIQEGAAARSRHPLAASPDPVDQHAHPRAAGVALGAEPADPRAMHRGPRPSHEHVLGALAADHLDRSPSSREPWLGLSGYCTAGAEFRPHPRSRAGRAPVERTFGPARTVTAALTVGGDATEGAGHGGRDQDAPTVEIRDVLTDEATADLLRAAAPYDVTNIVSHEVDLEAIFLDYYTAGS